MKLILFIDQIVVSSVKCSFNKPPPKNVCHHSDSRALFLTKQALYLEVCHTSLLRTLAFSV